VVQLLIAHAGSLQDIVYNLHAVGHTLNDVMDVQRSEGYED
jgi:hypothetical protein